MTTSRRHRVRPHYAVSEHWRDDPRAKPPLNTAKWRPFGSSYEYVITRSDAHDFEIRSTNESNLQDCSITRRSSPLPSARVRSGDRG